MAIHKKQIKTSAGKLLSYLVFPNGSFTLKNNLSGPQKAKDGVSYHLVHKSNP
jgi:hypothetical protein